MKRYWKTIIISLVVGFTVNILFRLCGASDYTTGYFQASAFALAYFLALPKKP